MKKLNMQKLSIFIISFFSIFTCPTFAQNATGEQIIIPLSTPGEPGLINVGHIKGSIFVMGYDGEAVIVNASARRMGAGNPDNLQNNGLKRITSNLIQLSAQEKDNEVIIETNSHRHTIDLDIRIPYHFALRLKTYHNGKIHVKNVSGEMEVSNMNGDVLLEEISGSAVVNTIDGHITVTFVEVTPEIPMAFTSIEGKIDVTFPPDINASVKMKSDNGEIFSDFDIEMEKRKIQVDKSDQTGLYKVSLDEWVNGQINGGGPEILFKTLEGDIYIRKAE